MNKSKTIISLIEKLISEKSIPSVDKEIFKKVLDKNLHQYLDNSLPERQGQSFKDVIFPIHIRGDEVWVHSNIQKLSDNYNTFRFNMDYYSELAKKFIDLINDDSQFNKGKFAKKYGWFFVGKPTSEISTDSAFIFAPTHINKFEEDLPEFLYHITLKKNLEGIQKRGLIPTKGTHNLLGRDFRPDRVYVTFNKYDVIYLRDCLARALNNRNIREENPEKYKLSDYGLVIIDTSKLRKGTKFYKDPEFAGDYRAKDSMYFTNTHIPPEACIIKKSFKGF